MMKTPIIRDQLETEELKHLVERRPVDFCKFLARNKIRLPSEAEPRRAGFDFSALTYFAEDGKKFDFSFVADLYAACIDIVKPATGKDFLYVDC